MSADCCVINIDIINQNTSLNYCPICYSGVLTHQNSVKLSCGHKFCISCITIYIKITIETNAVIRCPQDGCKVKIVDKYIKQNLLKEDYIKYSKAEQIKKQSTIGIQCPSQLCLLKIKINKKLKFTVCKCGIKICNCCLNSYHTGKSCLEVNINPQVNNVRLCTSCKTLFQKYDGCDHITCPKCKFEWCWSCGDQWIIGHNSTICKPQKLENDAISQIQTKFRFKCNFKTGFEFQKYLLDIIYELRPYYMVVLIFIFPILLILSVVHIAFEGASHPYIEDNENNEDFYCNNFCGCLSNERNSDICCVIILWWPIFFISFFSYWIIYFTVAYIILFPAVLVISLCGTLKCIIMLPFALCTWTG